MPTKWMKPLRKIIAHFDRVVMQEMSGWTEARTPEAMMAVEQEVHQAARRLADVITATVMGSIVDRAYEERLYDYYGRPRYWG